MSVHINVGLINAGDPAGAVRDAADVGRMIFRPADVALAWAGIYDAAISAACCAAFSLFQLFRLMSTGSYMNHSALSPGAVRHLSCSYSRNAVR